MEPIKKKISSSDAYGEQLRTAGGLPPIQNAPQDDSLVAPKSMMDSLGQKYAGLCQAFVEATLGSGWKGSSAIDAWNRQQKQAVSGLGGIKAGDPIYFSADNSNQGNGHTGIYMGNGSFLSATDTGIQNLPINKWTQATGQKILGYLKTK